MSLGTWFRDYVYFPLGGSKVNTRGRLILNLFLTWLATGIWHGANWTFIAWGLLYGVLITIEKVFCLPQKMEKRKNISLYYQIFTMVLVVLGWVLFRSYGIRSAVAYICNMFGLRKGIVFVDSNTYFYFREYLVFIAAGIVCATPVWGKLKKIACRCNTAALSIFEVSMCIAQVLLFMVSASYLVISAHNPFIYFNF